MASTPTIAGVRRGRPLTLVVNDVIVLRPPA